jgi:hypothetical protein
MRRAKPRHAPTFLVDQYKRIVAFDGGAQFGYQRAQLRRVDAVAREKDEPERIGIAEQTALVVAQRRSGAADDGRPRP